MTVAVAIKRARAAGRPMGTVSFRVDDAMAGYLESELALERSARPGSHIVISDIVRELVAEGLQRRILQRARGRKK